MPSKGVVQKCKQFIWTLRMVGDLLNGLEAFRTKVEFEGPGFDEASAQSQLLEMVSVKSTGKQ